MGGFLLPFVYALEIAGLFLIGNAFYHRNTSGAEIKPSTAVVINGRSRPVEVALDPSMDPVRFHFEATVDKSHVDRSRSIQPTYYYQMTLSLHGKPVLTDSLGFSTALEGKDRDEVPRRTGVEFEWPNVPAAGNYLLAVDYRSGGDRRTLPGISVTARRNVEGFNMKKIWWGIGLIVFGGLVHFLFKPATLEENEH